MPGMNQRAPGTVESESRHLPGLRSIVQAAHMLVARFDRRLECPLCHGRLRQFLPFGLELPVLKELSVIGGGHRENALCPFCGCIDRERLLFLYLVHQTDIFRLPARVLHVAPEARVAEFMHKQATIDYVTADLTGSDVMFVMDITRIQFDDCSFDAIICNHVLEHVVDDARAMSELHRVLRPGGWAVLQVPISRGLARTREDFSITSAPEREAAFGQADHVRIYGSDYPARLERAGFEVDIFSWLSQPRRFGGRRNRFGLNPNECVFVGRKPGGMFGGLQLAGSSGPA